MTGEKGRNRKAKVRGQICGQKRAPLAHTSAPRPRGFAASLCRPAGFPGYGWVAGDDRLHRVLLD